MAHHRGGAAHLFVAHPLETADEGAHVGSFRLRKHPPGRLGLQSFPDIPFRPKGCARPGRLRFISGANSICNAPWRGAHCAPHCDLVLWRARWALWALRPYAPSASLRPHSLTLHQLHFGDAFCDAGTFAVCPETGQLFCCLKAGSNNTIAAQCDETISTPCPSNADLVNCGCPSNVTYSDFVPYLTAESWQDQPYNPYFNASGTNSSSLVICNDTGR